jgi:hypothetical protein
VEITWPFPDQAPLGSLNYYLHVQQMKLDLDLNVVNKPLVCHSVDTLSTDDKASSSDDTVVQVRYPKESDRRLFDFAAAA